MDGGSIPPISTSRCHRESPGFRAVARAGASPFPGWYTASYGADKQHEATAFSLALLGATERLRIIAAVHPGMWHPGVLAKWLITADHVSGGRAAVNIVSGWLKDEFTLSPKLLELTGRDHPEIIFGGNSTAAQATAGRVADWYFSNGRSLDGYEENVAGRPCRRRAGRPDAEVRPQRFRDRTRQLEDLVQYNDGFKTQLIGTPEQVADRIIAYMRIGVNLLLTAYLHFQEELAAFGRDVLPIVREKEKDLAREHGTELNTDLLPEEPAAGRSLAAAG